MEQQTSQQRLRDFCADYGIPKVMLRANEEFDAGSATADTAIVRLMRYSVEDRSSGRYVKSKSTVMLVFRKVECRWFASPAESMTMADETFEPIVIPTWAGKSITEYIEHERFSRLCAKPGTPRSPMLSYDRVLAEGSTPAMERHW